MLVATRHLRQLSATRVWIPTLSRKVWINHNDEGNRIQTDPDRPFHLGRLYHSFALRKKMDKHHRCPWGSPTFLHSSRVLQHSYIPLINNLLDHLSSPKDKPLNVQFEPLKQILEVYKNILSPWDVEKQMVDWDTLANYVWNKSHRVVHN